MTGGGGNASGGKTSSGGSAQGGVTSAGGINTGGVSQMPPARVCSGQPIDCIPLCQGGICDCYCEHSRECFQAPVDAGACGNCFNDFQCAENQRCYGAACGMSADAPKPGDCRQAPPEHLCWGDEDCGNGQVCMGASVCECGSACLVADTPGNCIDTMR
jgi:hypothetical protein